METRRRPRFSDDHLLDAARALFVERGFGATTMADIASAAGTTKPTLYARYGDKDGLVLACARRDCERMRAYLVGVYRSARGLSVREQIGRGMRAVADYAAQSPEEFTFLTRVEWPRKHETLEQLQSDLAEEIGSSIEHTMATRGRSAQLSAVADLAAFLVALGWRAALQAGDAGADRVSELADIATELTLGGLRGDGIATLFAWRSAGE